MSEPTPPRNNTLLILLGVGVLMMLATLARMFHVLG